MADLRFPLAKQQLHTLLDVLGMRDEFKFNFRTISSAQNTLWVIHLNHANCLSHSLKIPLSH